MLWYYYKIELGIDTILRAHAIIRRSERPYVIEQRQVQMEDVKMDLQIKRYLMQYFKMTEPMDITLQKNKKCSICLLCQCSLIGCCLICR
jgi:hypothetical protein